MANMVIQIKVKDFAEWEKVFNSSAGLRKSNGELSHQIYRDAGDPNKLAIMYQWDSLANGQKFFQSPELKAAQQKAGVEGPPNLYVPLMA
jgi:heme-degrading monooxygenase HmoA